MFAKIPLTLKILIPSSIIIFFVATAKPKPEPAPPAETAVVKTQVETIVVEKATQQVTVSSQGVVEPIRSSQLMAQVSGKIVKVADTFADGGAFQQNQVLIELDDSDYQFALAQAQASLADAKMQLATEQALAQEAQRQWQELGSAEANALFKREPQLSAAQARYAAAQASLNKAKLDLSRTKISLPFDGRIEHTLVGVGQFVSPGAPLASIFDTSKVQVKLPLTEQQAALIDNSIIQLSNSTQAQQTAQLVQLESFYAGQQHQWSGKIERISAAIDNNTRMLDLIVTVEHKAQKSQHGLPLLVGLFVNGNITSKPLEQLVELPKQALFKRNQIYIINQDGQIEQQTVTVVGKTAEQVWISSKQLTDGSQVIISKLGFLSPGTDVESTTKIAQNN
ncbi:secretion protein HlyD [Catenovulum agarivorans DS-2]|uniref:Secretion protein HlyD n=1 Tax=Catenovulum agarivorans DS-2 TaxID=1328313 RepID=W7QJ55_9ALTE|nr:efflux RND transporter periplasmic adaptor subunit [Catenovulum agarivorans]EWH08957.1 secretion protein HlyD [Catenovulum agarivorans DS-2]